MLGCSTTLVLEMTRVLTLTCIAALSFFSCPLSFRRSNLDLCLSHVRCRLALLFHNFDGRSCGFGSKGRALYWLTGGDCPQSPFNDHLDTVPAPACLKSGLPTAGRRRPGARQHQQLGQAKHVILTFVAEDRNLPRAGIRELEATTDSLSLPVSLRGPGSDKEREPSGTSLPAF